jgi:hypothetical protein
MITKTGGVPSDDERLGGIEYVVIALMAAILAVAAYVAWIM